MDQPTQAGSADRSLKGRFKRLGNALLEALFPETFVCFGCGAELNGAVLPLCEACIAALPVRQGEFCPLCGATVAKKGELCRHCAQQKPHFDSVNAPYFNGADLLIAADCTAYAYGDFHQRFMKDHVTLIGCPKLDPVDYSEKLSDILRHNDIRSLTIVRMEVSC